MRTKEYQNKDKSILYAVCIGVLISVTVMLIGVIVTSLLVANETVSSNTTSYWVMGISLVSSMIGSAVAIGIAKRQLAIVGISTSMAFMLILISLTAIFYGGQYSGVPATLLLILCGGISSVIIKSKKIVKQKTRRKNVKL